MRSNLTPPTWHGKPIPETDPNSEALDGPSDTPWTEEEKARYAAGRAVTVAMAEARKKLKRTKKQSFTLATETESVRFEIGGDKAVLFRCSLVGPWPRYPSDWIVTMSLDEARGEWARLKEAGYVVW